MLLMIKILLLFMGFVLISADSRAQTRTITGKVTDEAGNPIANASIQVRNATTGTTSSEDGTFTLNLSENAKVLLISSINYLPVEVPLGKNASFVNPILKAAAGNLAEVIVVGYGTQKKSNVTAAISTVSAAKLENKPFSSVDQMLQGAAAGLQSTASTGQPGASQPIRIRGVGSFSYSGGQPLYIIDGVQINSGDLSNGNGGGFSINPSTNVLATLNSDDIENISVLKDAAATSIYGSRGGNGVIIITTKSGRAGKTQYRFDTEIGTNEVILPPSAGRPLRAKDWFVLLREGMVNANLNDATITSTLNNYGYGSGIDIGWFDLITRRGAQQQYNLSISGGDPKNKFYISGGYFKQMGTTIGADLKRISANLKYTHLASDRLQYTTKLTIGNVDQNSALASSGPSGGGGYFGNPAYVALVLRPTQNPYNSDGSLNISGNNTGFPVHYNPLYVAAHDKRWLKAFNGIGNEMAELKIIKGLKFSTNIGLQYSINEEYQFNNPFHGDGSGTSTNGEGISIYTRNFLWDWVNQFDYHYDFLKVKNLSLDFKAAYEASRNNNYQQLGDVTGFPPRSDLYYSTNGATSTNGKAGASAYTFSSYFSNLNLSLNDRYSLYGSFRRDASSRFGINNPWANFGSVGASWNVINEPFLHNVSVISNLKLRASFGTNGNAEIGNYQWRQTYGYGYNYNGIAGGTFNNIGNLDLTWERNKQADVGLDVSFFKNRISITTDYYNRTTQGALLQQQISRTTGFTSFINNVGNIENKGLEFTLHAMPVKVKDFTWDVYFNFSRNKNTITKLPSNNQPSGSYLLREGESIYSFYTRGWAGVNASDGSPTWFVDSTRQKTTSTYASAQQYLVGKTALPKYFGAAGTTISYKDFSINADFYYNYGNYIQEAYARFFLDGTFPTRGKYAINLTRWQKAGDVTDVPKYVYGTSNNSATGSDRLLFKGDYIRLRNVQFMYRLHNESLQNKLHILALNLYVRGTNIWTKTYDPRLLSDPEQGILGINNQELPPSKSFTAGINVTF
ncbi:MAG: TonB-dependent receptor [Flavisolibacter sp.]